MANKTAIVTGGTRGIGKAIILKLAGEGFDIGTCARDKTALALLKQEVEKAHPKSIVHVLTADLSSKSDVMKFGDFAKAQFDAIDILINNTGIFIPGEIQNEEDGSLEMMINTNLYSAYYLTRGILPNMVARQSGHIFNMCSIASITAYPNGGSYSISKFALYGMSKVLREEMKPHGIRVTSVLPGATYTSSWEGADVPEERLMKSSDIADAVWAAYALSETSVIEDLVIRPQLGDL